ncbi:hypothetical protein [Micromonospora humidisoli]|uniref:SH3 domain-containing protein n=1 Tax=Micromonospora humidisoli TaxID=2807622 RepID=A0ABS2JG56_9ACTN|nr:hypothetical protein [Micromonospora humidisoli]MBM7085507.1 hypothetical protein [Micromonospora humidisoli]
MSADDAVIDLDAHRHESAGPTTGPARHTVRPRIILGLVAAFAAGAVLGGWGVDRAQEARARQERDAAVALVAIPAGTEGGGTNSDGRARIEGSLAVVNAGPALVTVRSVRAESPTVLVRDLGRTWLIRPGGTGWIGVVVLFQCGEAPAAEPLPVRFSVQTADGQVREARYPVAIVGSTWLDVLSTMCEPR